MNTLLFMMQWMALVVFASVIQRNWKVPLPITLLLTIIIGNHFQLPLFKINLADNNFDLLVLITLPLLIAADALKLEWSDIKEHGLSLFWTAGVSVFLSVGAGVFLTQFILVSYNIPVAGIVVLFAMLVATDPVTVSAIFSNVHVPHKLKILTEGESLFNDAAALIVFSLGVIGLTQPETIDAIFVFEKIFLVIGGAVIIGFIIGATLSYLLKLSDDPFVEGTMILLAAYGSYYLAEQFHCSGILAIIVAMLFVSHQIRNFLAKSDNDIESAQYTNNFKHYAYALTTKDNILMVNSTVQFMALLSATALFISIGMVTELETLWKYRNEILLVFLMTTLIRGVIMLKFAAMTRFTNKMHTVPMHWWGVLTFAGSKGALSILMVHMIPNTFEYKVLFEHIVIGNILLSIIIYAPLLSLIIKVHKSKFEQEVLEET